MFWDRSIPSDLIRIVHFGYGFIGTRVFVNEPENDKSIGSNLIFDINVN